MAARDDECCSLDARLNEMKTERMTAHHYFIGIWACDIGEARSNESHWRLQWNTFEMHSNRWNVHFLASHKRSDVTLVHTNQQVAVRPQWLPFEIWQQTFDRIFAIVC